MKADTLTPRVLFQKDVRYIIPSFQRPYVWEQSEQWEPLWEDVRNTAERYMDHLADTNGNAPLAEERTGTHFLGAVVLQQRPNAAAELETRDVIDGQQRMTTLQLLIDAVQEVLQELGEEKEARRLSRLVTNAYASGDELFKLWPTALDQDAFRAAMTSGADATVEFATSLVVQAHSYFRLQVREWIEHGGQHRASRVHALETTLFGLLELVVIDLATADDSFVIFETLNARGTPLRASDLIKNFVLQSATKTGDARTAEESWASFDDEWWRKEVRQGRIRRQRLDQFINYWLVMKTLKEVQAPDVFPTFKSFVEASAGASAAVAAELAAHSVAYRSLVDGAIFSDLFLERWTTLDIGTSTPLLLWFATRSDGEVSEGAIDRATRVLESYLVRRMICRMTTKDYNKLFIEILVRLTSQADHDVDVSLSEYLLTQESESRRWPTDAEVVAAVVGLPLYRLLTRGRVRLLLEAIEDDLRTAKTEDMRVTRGLTIEHIMPQSWEANWPIPPDVPSAIDLRVARPRLVHTLGNLTLVNEKLNPAMSNSAWDDKRKALDESSVLFLNKRLLKEWGEVPFDDEAIATRSSRLARRICQIWPRPEGPDANRAGRTRQ